MVPAFWGHVACWPSYTIAGTSFGASVPLRQVAVTVMYP